MKLYRITVDSERNADFRPIWVGTQSDAGKTRKELVADGFKRAEITTDEVDVPTNKEGLLAFLNGLEN
jgi:hypothetical protein